jgi:acyl-CoA thioester hydrolase
MSANARPPASCRADYRVFRPVPTRWMDNDVFGHVNNVTYYSYFDTAVTAWLMANRLLGFTDGPMWMVADTGCRFLSQVAFPDMLSIGLRLGRLGTSSIRWELAAFRDTAQDASAEGHFVHVHVDRATRRPMPFPDAVRKLVTEALSVPHTE